MAVLGILLLFLQLVALANLSCASEGNATAAEREDLLQKISNYWDNEKEYSLGYTSGVGKIMYADVQGDEAEVEAEIVLGYRQPTEGAGYKVVTFRLRREGGSWEVTYDGWTGKEVGNPL